MRTVLLVTFVLCLGISSKAQEVSYSERQMSGIQLILDSASKYINLQFLKLDIYKIRDSVFLQSDTICRNYWNTSDSSMVESRCYNKYNNYVYRNVGAQLSKEFLNYSHNLISDSLLEWSIEDFRLRNTKSVSAIDSIRKLKSDSDMSWISVPLFSQNDNFMLVEFGEVCGSLCGHGYTSLYEFKEDSWVLSGKFAYWHN